MNIRWKEVAVSAAVWLVIVGCAGLLLAACKGPPAQNIPLIMHGPDEYGVICYERAGYENSYRAPLSCVQVLERK